MPFPLVPVALGGAALFGLYKLMSGHSSSKPVLQSLRRTSPTGVPVQVIVPVTDTKVATSQSVVPIAGPVKATQAATLAQPNNTGTGATYAPPPVIAKSGPQGQLNLAPMIITPTGAATLAVMTTQDLQNALNALGYGPLTVDGIAGPKTTAAVKAFQTKAGLSVDGIVGPNTKGQLQDALAHLAGTGAALGSNATVTSADASTPSAVATAASGNPVTVNTAKDVQHALNLLGASPALVEDGIAGAKTIAAIKVFQISHGLVADGVAGPKTKTALALACNSPPASMTGEFSGTSHLFG